MTPTKQQLAWMARVEKLLSNPPPNIGLYTIGDRRLQVYDSRRDQEINDKMDRGSGCDFCTAVHKLDAELGCIESSMSIHSTSG